VAERIVAEVGKSPLRGSPVPLSRRIVAALTTVALLALAFVAAPPSSGAVVRVDARRPYVVTLGDSYISGEAGRWAGSSDVSSTYADALGPTAYFDNRRHTAERIPGCHRSRSAEAYLRHGVRGLDLACSGAKTSTYTNGHGDFKPGLDFFDDGAGHVGQALALRRFATSHPVAMVVVSIGGNDFNFASIITQCVTDFLTSPDWLKNFCNDDSSVTQNFTAHHVATVTTKVARALRRVRKAMREAGYADGSWALVVQTYPSPIPDGRGFRYTQADFTRQSVGGCGFWNADANWANSTALPTINATVKAAVRQSGVRKVKLLNVAHAFNGRRLCESTVGLYEEEGLTSWRQDGAVNKTEWVNQIRTLSAVLSPYQVQESLHPNYWGQLALRSCLRKVYHHGHVRGGSCVIAARGLRQGEPRMRLR
jgi:hypothetical protein